MTFRVNLGVVQDVYDRRRTLLLDVNGYQVSAAGDNGSSDFGFLAGFEFSSWRRCVSEGAQQQDEHRN